MKNYLFLALALCLSLNSLSQAEAPKIKFGKVSKDELEMKVYEKDSSADAVILFDKGYLNFIYNNNSTPKGFEYQFTRHLRIKFLNKNSFDYANRSIRLRHSATKEDKLTKLKAYTFNLIDGKIEKEKISLNDIMREKYADGIDLAKFTMPNVKEGSVIDIEYTIQSDYIYYLPEWRFQYNIPAVWSEYELIVPEFYFYNYYIEGVNSFTIKEESKKSETFTYEWENSIHSNSNRSGRIEVNSSEIDSDSKVYRFASNDVPAFKKEPFMASTDNYLFKVKFELSWRKFPNSPYDYYTNTWESTNQNLMNRSDFGGYLNANIPNDVVPEIIKGLTTDEEKAYAIFSYVQNNIRWNENISLIPDKSPRTVLKDKSGSSSEINMLLIVMLREAGINAHPVVSSTRNNGLINKSRPGYEQLNYTLAYALINQNNYLMDATDPYCYPNFLPKRCLNGDARIVGENFTDWINLNSKVMSKNIIGCNLKIEDDASFSGKIQKTKTNYFANNFRNEMDDYESNDKYIEELQNKNHNLEISDFSFENMDSLHLPIKTLYEVNLTEIADLAGDMIIFKPLNIYTDTDNPFTAEERKYPIDFTYPFEELYVMNYQIPEGYQVEEMPESIQMVTPDKSASFLFKAVANGNLIQITLKKSIIKTFYLPSEYEILKNFYNQMITKQNENIILKKKA